MPNQNMLSVVQLDVTTSGLTLKKEIESVAKTITAEQTEHPNIALIFMTMQQRYFHNAKAFHKMLAQLNKKYQCGFMIAVHDTPFESEEAMMTYVKENNIVAP